MGREEKKNLDNFGAGPLAQARAPRSSKNLAQVRVVRCEHCLDKDGGFLEPSKNFPSLK